MILVPFGVNYLVESGSIAGALVAYGRGANPPYFGKQGNILPYSPREQKRKAIRGFPEVSDIPERGKESDLGLFPAMGDDITSWEGKTSAMVSARTPTGKKVFSVLLNVLKKCTTDTQLPPQKVYIFNEEYYDIYSCI